MRKRQILEILDNITIKGCECDPEINFHCTIHSEVAILINIIGCKCNKELNFYCDIHLQVALLKDFISKSVVLPKLDTYKAMTKNIYCVK